MAPVGEGFKKFGEKYGSQARIGLYENNDHHARYEYKRNDFHFAILMQF